MCPKDKNAIWDRTLHSYTPILVYIYIWVYGVQRSQIFKQNQSILISSRFIECLLIRDPPGCVDGLDGYGRGSLGGSAPHICTYTHVHIYYTWYFELQMAAPIGGILGEHLFSILEDISPFCFKPGVGSPICTWQRCTCYTFKHYLWYKVHFKFIAKYPITH